MKSAGQLTQELACTSSRTRAPWYVVPHLIRGGFTPDLPRLRTLYVLRSQRPGYLAHNIEGVRELLAGV
jgi:hypothetical protein